MNAGATAAPLAFVATVTDNPLPANVPLAPLVGVLNVTGTPCIGRLLESRTVACRATGNVEPGVMLCGVPAIAEMLAGVILVSAYEIGETKGSPIVAVALYEPPIPFAVRVREIAIPCESVIAVAVFEPPKRALAPDVGALNVTVKPLKFIPDSLTLALSEPEMAR